MSHKNDYTVVVFMEDGTAKKWGYVHNLGGFASFLNKSHSSWKYFNVYNRRQGKYLKRFYKGNFVPPFLTFIIFALSSTFFLTFNNTRSDDSLNSTFSKTFSKHSLRSPLYDIYNTATIPTNCGKKGGVLC
jgi:hypothetical protein